MDYNCPFVGLSYVLPVGSPNRVLQGNTNIKLGYLFPSCLLQSPLRLAVLEGAKDRDRSKTHPVSEAYILGVWVYLSVLSRCHGAGSLHRVDGLLLHG